MKLRLHRLRNKNTVYWLLFLAAILIGIWLRLHSIATFPCGLAPDEVSNALVAARGQMAFIYNNPFNESEGFFISFIILLSKLIGLGVWQVYASSVLLGIAAIIIGGLAIKKHFGPYVALVAVFLLSTSSWHIALSHSGTWTITTPFFLALLFLCLPRHGLKASGGHFFQKFLLGVVFSIGLYGYLSYRTVLFILLAYIVVSTVRQLKLGRSLGEVVRKSFLSSSLFALGACMSIVPLLIGYAQHPNIALGRTIQVLQIGHSFEDTLLLLQRNAFFILRGLFVHGSDNWHQNLGGQPFLFWVLIPFFFLGLFEQVKKTFRYIQGESENPIPFLVILSFMLFFLPNLLTDSSPHGGRLGGEILFVYTLVAIGSMILLRANKYVSVFFILSACFLLLLAPINNLKYRTQSTSYARDYFCDMRDVGEYLASDKLLLGQEAKLYVVGSEYETGPLTYYMNIPRQRFHAYQAIPYQDLEHTRLDKNGIVVVPAFTFHGFERIHSWLDEGIATPPLTLLLEKNPDLKLIFASNNANQYWYSDNRSFLVFEMSKDKLQ